MAGKASTRSTLSERQLPTFLIYLLTRDEILYPMVFHDIDSLQSIKSLFEFYAVINFRDMALWNDYYSPSILGIICCLWRGNNVVMLSSLGNAHCEPNNQSLSLHVSTFHKSFLAWSEIYKYLLYTDFYRLVSSSWLLFVQSFDRRTVYFKEFRTESNMIVLVLLSMSEDISFKINYSWLIRICDVTWHFQKYDDSKQWLNSPLTVIPFAKPTSLFTKPFVP